MRETVDSETPIASATASWPTFASWRNTILSDLRAIASMSE
jgi:hypothetical protein